MRKSKVLQDLVNVYPPSAKIRIDEQSIGQQVFNTFANTMEHMDEQLFDQEKNNFLTTANQKEIDLTYRVELPTSFDFDLNSIDPTNPTPISPTVKGLVINDAQSGWVTITQAELNNVKSFWYDSVPNRANVSDVVSGFHVLRAGTSNINFPWSGEINHHLYTLGGGAIWIETQSGLEYISTNDRGKLDRATIIIRGTTRKGSEESETFIFPWDQKQCSKKEWKILSSIEVYNLEDDISVVLTSADFNNQPHLRHYNIKHSPNRNKIDEFFGLSDDGKKLQRIQYISDEWQQLVLGFSDQEVKEEWNLLNSNYLTVSGVDLAMEPFSNRAWVATVSGMLYCYDLEEYMVSGVTLLEGKTPNSEINLEVINRNLILGDEIRISPLHVRPLQEITKYKIWYRTPSGSRFGLRNGTAVSYTSNYWAYPTQVNRVIEPDIVLIANEYGEYLFTIEAVMVNGNTFIDKVVVKVQNKLPLTTINIRPQLSQNLIGIDFDSNQRLWARTAAGYYPIDLYTDIMLIDYDNKVIYLKELYQSIEVIK